MNSGKYETWDLFRAAAIMAASGQPPDGYRIDYGGRKPRVYCVWNKTEGIPIEDLETHKLKIDPLKFKDCFFDLKDTIFGKLEEDGDQ